MNKEEAGGRGRGKDPIKVSSPVTDEEQFQFSMWWTEAGRLLVTLQGGVGVHLWEGAPAKEEVGSVFCLYVVN